MAGSGLLAWLLDSLVLLSTYFSLNVVYFRRLYRLQRAILRQSFSAALCKIFSFAWKISDTANLTNCDGRKTLRTLLVSQIPHRKVAGHSLPQLSL